MNCNGIRKVAATYISGELDREQTAEFQAHLNSCAQCRAQIVWQTELDSRLRREILAGTPDSSVLENRIRSAIAREPHPRFLYARRFLGAVAAIVLLLLGVGFALRVWIRPQPIQLCNDAARDHVREIVRQEPRRWTADRAAIDTLAQRAGVRIATIDGFSAPGYELERGRLCRLDGRVFLHLVYSNGARRFSMFLAPSASTTSYGLFTAGQNGEQIATVQSARERAVVVTEESSGAARDLARIAMSVL